MACVFWLQPKFALTIASQLENLPRSANAAGEPAVFSYKPVVILTAGSASETRREAHARMAALLPNALHSVAKRSAHWIMQDQPEIVVSAIESLRTAGPASYRVVGQGERPSAPHALHETWRGQPEGSD